MKYKQKYTMAKNMWTSDHGNKFCSWNISLKKQTKKTMGINMKLVPLCCTPGLKWSQVLAWEFHLHDQPTFFSMEETR